jgi:hypothetical protein
VGTCALAEQRNGVRLSQGVRVLGRPGNGQRERRYRVALLGPQGQRLATGGEDGERGTCLEQSGDEWRGR